MAVTDLTNTTWVFNDAPGKSWWNGTYNINFISNSNNYTSFELDNGNYPLIKYNNVIVANLETTGWTNSAYKTIEITSGTDITNSYLIAYIQANATQVLPQPTVVYDLDTLNLSAGTYTITVKAKATGYADSINSNSISYTILPQLPSSSNVSVSGTEVSFDEVENAESYDILVDGNSIGNTRRRADIQSL